MSSDQLSEAAQHPTVLDPAAQQLGRVYAQALLAAGSKEQVADQLVDQLQQLVQSLGDHPALAEIFASPRVSDDEKSRVLDRLLSGRVHPLLLRFLKVAAKRGRLGFLAHIGQAAVEMRDESLGRTVAHVRTAVPLDDASRKEVVAQVGRMVQREVVLRETVDPSVLGGIVIRVGDTVYDASVAGRLQRMAQTVRGGFARRLTQQASQFFSGDVAS